MKCPECKSSKTITNYNKGETYCKSCGLVIEENMPDQVNPYATNPIFTGNYVVFSREERRIIDGQWDITIISDNLNLPDSVRREANRLWWNCVMSKLTRGRGQLELVSACLYQACKLHDYKIKLYRITSVFQLNPKTVENFSELIAEKLKFPTKMSKNIEILGKKLQLDTKVIEEAKVLAEAKRSLLERMQEKTFICSLLYCLSKKKGLKYSPIQFSRKGNVSLASIKRGCDLLEAHNGKG